MAVRPCSRSPVRREADFHTDLPDETARIPETGDEAGEVRKDVRVCGMSDGLSIVSVFLPTATFFTGCFPQQCTNPILATTRESELRE